MFEKDRQKCIYIKNSPGSVVIIQPNKERTKMTNYMVQFVKKFNKLRALLKLKEKSSESDEHSE